MCSQNRDEVEVVKTELLKAGIASETRSNAMAKTLGVTGVELWVADGRDSLAALKVYSQMREGNSGRPEEAGGNVQTATVERPAGTGQADYGKQSSSPAAKGVDSRRSGHEQLKQARALLEKGLEGIFQREAELAGECALLRTHAEELNQALAQAQAALKRETESRAAAERNHAEQITGMERELEQERQNWQQQMQSQDELVKKTQLNVEAVSRLLETQQGAVATLKERIVALELQRQEHERSLCQARTEALAEREARIAAEERAAKADQTHKSIEIELLQRRELEQQMRAYVTNLNSLCGQMRDGAR